MIAVALSGGVDSTVAAALLKESGQEVIGLFMDLGLGRPGARQAAAAAAAEVGVPFHVLDLKEIFRRRVVEPFLDAYARGQTPNPCAVCNRAVKFEELLKKGRALGARGLATGHYVRLSLNRGGQPALCRGAERGKEQSYFLARLDRSWLNRLHFPLGGLTKAQVRGLAQERGLQAAARPESQEICFLGGEDYRAFFRRRRQPRPGLIVGLDGRELGRHQGLFNYTVGQRRGLGLPAERPWYVVALDGRANQVIVGPEEALYRRRAQAAGCAWLSSPQDLPKKVSVQVRYRARPLAAELERLSPQKVNIHFAEPQKAVAPGQLAAFYLDDQLLGGGWLRPSPPQGRL